MLFKYINYVYTYIHTHILICMYIFIYVELFLNCVWVFCWHVYLHIVYAWCLRRPEEFPGTGVTGMVVSCPVVLGIERGPSEEQPVLFGTEPSFWAVLIFFILF